MSLKHDLYRFLYQITKFNTFYLDSLTGVYIRDLILRLAEMEFDQSRRYKLPLTVMMLDIDHFKKVNDTYGHSTGDAVLKSTAQVFSTNLRKADIIGRYGGEEFLVILPVTGELGATLLAKRLLKVVSENVIKSKKHSVTVTVSIGIATFDPQSSQDDNVNALIDRADKALYEAKNGGRNTFRVG